MKAFTKILGVLLSLVLIIGMLAAVPFSVQAEVASVDDDEVTDLVPDDGTPGVQYTFDDESGELCLISGEFNKDSKWGEEVVAEEVTQVVAEEGVSFTGDCTGLFKGFINCLSIDLSAVDTSAATSMNRMFYECTRLEDLNVSGWDTSSVTDMNYMFRLCYRITELDLSDFDTSAVTDMRYIFSHCPSLRRLDVSGFSTASAGNKFVANMFKYDDNLSELVISPAMGIKQSMLLNNGDTAGWVKSDATTVVVSGGGDYAVIAAPDKVETYKWKALFPSRYSYNASTATLTLENGDFSSSDKWGDEIPTADVKKVVANDGVRFVGDCSRLFANFKTCRSMELGAVDTSAATSMNYMFYSCQMLTALDLNGWNTARAKNMSGMFRNCTRLTELDLSAFSTNGANINYMFYGDNKLSKLTVAPGMSIIGKMYLNNNGGNGWTTEDDPDTVISGTNAAAVITAPQYVTAYIWK